jgi:hypothetical protein
MNPTFLDEVSSVLFDFKWIDTTYFRGKHYPEPKDEQGEVESSADES